MVTVHTGIAYSSGAGETPTSNDIPMNWSNPDSQGNSVEKFLMSEVKTDAASRERTPGSG